MTRLAAALAVLAALAVGCGSDPPEAPEAARYLDPRSDMVMAVDVDYESGNWQQFKRLYERGVKAVDDEESVPPTLDGALEEVADWAGLSFSGDIKPLLGGTLLIGWRTEPAFTVMRPRGEGEPEFAARSDLRDPAAMAALLPRIAPHLPGILDGLQGLGSTGLSGLLFVAPDAPLTPSAFGLLAAIRVMPLPGSDQLYEISGLDRRGVRPGPDRVVFGIVGEAFVVASSQELAREAARMPTEPAPDAGTPLRADADALLAGEARDSDDARVVRALVAGLEASASAQDGDIEAEAEVRWAE
jgi:hypothetical protein